MYSVRKWTFWAIEKVTAGKDSVGSKWKLKNEIIIIIK